jgi:hypothetical protein
VILQHIERTFKGGRDIGKSLDDLEAIDLELFRPVRSFSLLSDEAERLLVDQAGLDMDYNGDRKLWKEHEKDLTEGLLKAYKTSTKSMQTRIEQHPNLTPLKRDPIALLTAQSYRSVDSYKVADARPSQSPVPLCSIHLGSMGKMHGNQATA